MVMRPLALALMLFSFMRDRVTTAVTTGDDTGEQKDNFLVELESGKGNKGRGVRQSKDSRLNMNQITFISSLDAIVTFDVLFYILQVIFALTPSLRMSVRNTSFNLEIKRGNQKVGGKYKMINKRCL